MILRRDDAVKAVCEFRTPQPDGSDNIGTGIFILPLIVKKKYKVTKWVILMAERQIRVIEAKPKKLKPFLNVGVYCRVSTPSQEQLHSLAAQVSHFVRKYHDLYNYRLYDVYIDVVSGAKTLARPGYQRMLEDCRGGCIDVIVTKSISRFGRDTGETLKCVRELMSMNVALIFEEEGIEAERGNELILTPRRIMRNAARIHAGGSKQEPRTVPANCIGVSAMATQKTRRAYWKSYRINRKLLSSFLISFCRDIPLI